MTVNLKLLNDTLNIIKSDPKTYDQNHWVNRTDYSPCGTTMCFAGQAAVLAGAEQPDPKKHPVIDDWYVAQDENNSYLSYHARNYIVNQHVQQFAQQALGISEAEGNYLFDGNRTMEEIEEAVEDLNELGYISDVDAEDEDDGYCCCCCAGECY